jgi:hypothetical protein
MQSNILIRRREYKGKIYIKNISKNLCILIHNIAENKNYTSMRSRQKLMSSSAWKGLYSRKREMLLAKSVWICITFVSRHALNRNIR